jgi:diguanylate cyclase (GGDEF)-like protein
MLVTVASLALALLSYVIVRLLPLRALDSALHLLSVQNARFEAALDNMVQGLCMLDTENNIAVANRQFIEMFGFATGSGVVGAPPQGLVQTVLHAQDTAQPAAFASSPPASANSAQTGTYSCDLPDGRIVTVARQMIAGGGWVATFEDITEKRKAELMLDHMALHDALTNLPNRVLFRVHLERELKLVDRGEKVAVLFLDLDHFKNVNDTLGHPVGDALLRMVAERLAKSVRDSDVVARLGGDEFAIIQSQADQPAHATALAQRLLDIIGAPYELDEHQIVVGVSLGIALGPTDGISADEILKNADLALYRAKADGRATYRFFEPAMDAQMQARRQLELDLRRALVGQELILYFQPLISVATRKVLSFEALLRWQHPARGLVQPGEFIALAEEVGLIAPIGKWVLEQACLEAVKWPEEIRLAVNVSAIQFRIPGLVEATTEALCHSGLAPGRLDIEITESVLMDNSQANLVILRRLRDLGAHISMDDFGTGYSSLSYLQSFPFDKIKIDQCFVRDLGRKEASSAIIGAVVHLGRALGMTVVAEGIETEAQLAKIKAEGCAEGQGYLFSKPCPASSIGSLLVRLNQSAAQRMHPEPVT